MSRLAGKVALITGATSGIGRGCALRMAAEGAQVVVSGIELENGRAVVDSIRHAGGTAIYVEHNVREEAAWQNAVAVVRKEFGRIDILINNAGEAIHKTIEKSTVADYRFLVGVNVEGPFLGMRTVVPVMERQGGGSIMNMSSVAGLRGGATHTLYCASKAAMAGLTKATAVAVRSKGIRVNSIHPGLIWGPGVIESLGEEGALQFRASIVTRIPMKRVGDPDDIAGVAVYLGSDESRHVSGVEFVADGGYMTV